MFYAGPAFCAPAGAGAAGAAAAPLGPPISNRPPLLFFFPPCDLADPAAHLNCESQKFDPDNNKQVGANTQSAARSSHPQGRVASLPAWTQAASLSWGECRRRARRAIDSAAIPSCIELPPAPSSRLSFLFPAQLTLDEYIRACLFLQTGARTFAAFDPQRKGGCARGAGGGRGQAARAAAGAVGARRAMNRPQRGPSRMGPSCLAPRIASSDALCIRPRAPRPPSPHAPRPTPPRRLDHAQLFSVHLRRLKRELKQT